MSSVDEFCESRKLVILAWNNFFGRRWSYVYSFFDILYKYLDTYESLELENHAYFFWQGRSGYTVYTANSNPLWISKYIPRTYPPIETLQIMWWLFLPIIALNQFLRATNIIYWNWKQIMSVSQFLKCARRGTLFWNKSKYSKSKILSFFNLNVKNEILEPHIFLILSQ